MLIVVLFWCNGTLRVPVAFRLWKPRQPCLRGEYRTKLQLAQEVLQEVLARGLRPTYVVFDAWHNARRFTRMLAPYRLAWVSVLKANAQVRPGHYYCSGSRFANSLAKDTSIQYPRLPRPSAGLWEGQAGGRQKRRHPTVSGDQRPALSPTGGAAPQEVALGCRGELPRRQAAGKPGSLSSQGAPGSPASYSPGPPQPRSTPAPRARLVRNGGPGQ
jgi:hypothetical protein